MGCPTFRTRTSLSSTTCKAVPCGTVRSMFSLMIGLGVSGLSAGLCFNTGFASGFVEELGGGFESCAMVQSPQEQARQTALIRCTNFTAILSFPPLRVYLTLG